MSWDFLDMELPGGTLGGWLIALAISALMATAVMLLKPVIVRRLSTFSGRTRNHFDDAILKAVEATRWWLVALISLSAGSQYLELSDKAEVVVGGVASFAGFLQAGLWLRAILRYWLTHSRSRVANTQPPSTTATASIGVVGLLAEFALWSVMVLLALDNMGVNITALVAGLGIGGVAVALAVQNILGDLFASLSIVVDKPFVNGDFIIVENDYMGNVEHIGLKSTRLRSLDGEQIIVGNADLLKTKLRNYKRMYERRCVFAFKLALNTPPDKVEKVPGMVRQIIESQKKIRFERSHFQKFGEGSLDFETVYWLLDPDYNLYADTQQAINLALMRALAKEKLALAYPTVMYVPDGTMPPPEPRANKGWFKAKDEAKAAETA